MSFFDTTEGKQWLECATDELISGDDVKIDDKVVVYNRRFLGEVEELIADLGVYDHEYHIAQVLLASLDLNPDIAWSVATDRYQDGVNTIAKRLLLPYEAEAEAEHLQLLAELAEDQRIDGARS